MNNIQQGWECPKCGKVYSPTQPECTKCPTADSVIKEESIKFSASGTTHTSLGHMFVRNGTSNICKICGLEEFRHPVITLTNNK